MALFGHVDCTNCVTIHTQVIITNSLLSNRDIALTDDIVGSVNNHCIHTGMSNKYFHYQIWLSTFSLATEMFI